MSDIQSFYRFSDFPTELRLLIWEHHFDSYFKSPLIHTLNGGFLSWDTGQLEPLSSLRSIISRGRLLKSLADRYDWHARDVPILQWKTVIQDLSPVSGKIYSAHRGVRSIWPRVHPLINHEAFDVARARCKRYDVIDLWLDNSTLNISQPCLVNVATDVFRIDPTIAKMMMGLNATYWLARIRRLAIGPLELGGRLDVVSILRILEHTRDLNEIYILLSPAYIESQTGSWDMRANGARIGISMVTTIGAAELYGSKMRELGSPASNIDYVTGDSDCAAGMPGYVTICRRSQVKGFTVCWRVCLSVKGANSLDSLVSSKATAP